MAAKPRYRLKVDGRKQQIPADATERFLRAAMDRWSAVVSARLEPAPYDPGLCEAHGVHIRDVIAAALGKTTPAAAKARVLLAWMGVDCASQQITEPTAEQTMALDLLVRRTLEMREQVRRERRMSALKRHIQEFPDLARAELAARS